MEKVIQLIEAIKCGDVLKVRNVLNETMQTRTDQAISERRIEIARSVLIEGEEALAEAEDEGDEKEEDDGEEDDE